MRKKVLVTGVAGFVASNLAKFLLARDYDVTGIALLTSIRSSTRSTLFSTLRQRVR
jgi:nucleoside-diphosphate-sugar epimerase